MNHDARLLRSFVVLADTLHFARAADRLHVSQPTLSQQIRRLEEQLGVKLLDRTSRVVALSEAGRAVLEHARAAVNAAAASRPSRTSTRRVAAASCGSGFSPGAHDLAQRLLAELPPDVRVSARQDDTGVLCRLLVAGELEIALGFCPSRAGHRRGAAAPRSAQWPRPRATTRSSPRRRGARRARRSRPSRSSTRAGGPGYNAAVRERCRAAGFEPRTRERPHGPMAWETAVRSERLRRPHDPLGGRRDDPRRPARAHRAAGYVPDRAAPRTRAEPGGGGVPRAGARLASRNARRPARGRDPEGVHAAGRGVRGPAPQPALHDRLGVAVRAAAARPPTTSCSTSRPARGTSRGGSRPRVRAVVAVDATAAMLEQGRGDRRRRERDLSCAATRRRCRSSTAASTSWSRASRSTTSSDRRSRSPRCAAASSPAGGWRSPTSSAEHEEQNRLERLRDPSHTRMLTLAS